MTWLRLRPLVRNGESELLGVMPTSSIHPCSKLPSPSLILARRIHHNNLPIREQHRHINLVAILLEHAANNRTNRTSQHGTSSDTRQRRTPTRLRTRLNLGRNPSSGTLHRHAPRLKNNHPPRHQANITETRIKLRMLPSGLHLLQ